MRRHGKTEAPPVARTLKGVEADLQGESVLLGKDRHFQAELLSTRGASRPGAAWLPTCLLSPQDLHHPRAVLAFLYSHNDISAFQESGLSPNFLPLNKTSVQLLCSSGNPFMPKVTGQRLVMGWPTHSLPSQENYLKDICVKKRPRKRRLKGKRRGRAQWEMGSWNCQAAWEGLSH